MLTAQPIEIGAARIAIHAGGGAIQVGTDKTLTFAGSATSVVPPGVLLLSDPVDMNVASMADLAVSLYFPRGTGTPTSHPIGLRTGYISRGDVTGSVRMPDPTTTLGYLWLSSVDVLAPAGAFSVSPWATPSRMDTPDR
jgi:hypothetical protein